MRRSTERILTTHTGSLPRPKPLIDMIYAREQAGGVDEALFESSVSAAVKSVVKKQADTGLDIVNDGEQGRVTYVRYIKDRLTGFEGQAPPPSGPSPEARDFPGYAKMLAARRPSLPIPQRACDGPIAYHNTATLEQELADFRAGLDGLSPAEAFLTTSSPGIIATFHPNLFYKDYESYVWAIADAMKTEYDTIHKAGFLVQVDCPDLALSRGNRFAELSLEEFRKVIALHVEALNYALRDIPSDGLRMHLCWGNSEGPHHLDVPLKDIVDIVVSAKPSGIAFEAANPRHAHEWKVWGAIDLPEEKVLIPGVLATTRNFIEHPELVSQRIQKYASIVGRERVIAGADCGFSTAAGADWVEPEVAWAKMAAMVEGAQLASKELWS